MDQREVKFIITNISPFDKLKENQVDELIAMGQVKEYNTGDLIYSQGSNPDFYYLLLQGRVLVFSQKDGQTSELELLKRGISFGIISLFTDDPHSVTAKAIENSSVLLVERDKFKSFLDKNPVLALDFSRLLNQRVKLRISPKKIFQCSRIGIMGFPSSGKATYMFNLGVNLKAQTAKKIICIEVSSRQDFTVPALIDKKLKVLNLKDFREGLVDLGEYIACDKVDCLLVDMQEPGNFHALLNAVSEQYHFVLYKIPSEFRDDYLKHLVSSADTIHFILSSKQDEVAAGNDMAKRMEKIDPLTRSKLKLVVNEFDKIDEKSFRANIKLMKYPVYATIPDIKDEEYPKAMIRISRQTGGVVMGVALGSGAAYGFCHIGVLQVLAENNITVDVISGSSMGSLISALWAAGFSIEEIKIHCRKFSEQIMSPAGFSIPFKGILKSRRVEAICKDIFKDMSFYDLKHGLRIVAFDFLRREAVTLTEGPLYKAVAASCAMPGIFEPIQNKKDILLDGGVLNPLPTRMLLQYGAHKIIAISVTPSLEELYRTYKDKKNYHVFDFIFGSIETMQREFIHQASSIADLVIHPDLTGIGWMEFAEMDEFVARGRKAALERLDEIKKLAIS